MRFGPTLLVALVIVQLPALAQNVVTVDPNDIQLSPYRHQDLPPALLKRIKAITDVFEMVDGISYARAVDLYKRDLDPEGNLVLWEEMVRAYTIYCEARCSTPPERMDVYRALLLRSMFSEVEAAARTQPKVLSPSEVRAVVKLYRLPPKPIDVVKGK